MDMNQYKTLLIALVTGFVGLGVGYLLFGNQSNAASEHAHAMEAGPETGAAAVWTCSMHPQVRQEEPGDCPICGMDLIQLDAAAANDPLLLEMTPEAVKLANIETTVVGATGTAGKRLILSGKVQADERRTASQVTHIAGRIERLFVSFTGERVRAGQRLATLYSPELITAQRELLEALKVQSVNPDLVKAARKKLTYWKITAEQIRAIEQSGTIQETITIQADASGVVAQRRVAVGDYVEQGAVLFDIIDLDRVWVLFDAYEADLASIEVGDRIEFTTSAIPNKTFTTRISFIDPVIDPEKRVAQLRAELRNPGNLLKPELFVRGTLQAQTSAAEQLVIPKSAVLWTGPRSVVYIKTPDTAIPTFQYREIELGERIGTNYRVEAGLEPGEEVVTYGSFAIDAAAQLNNQASMMNQDVQIKGATPNQTLPNYVAETPAAFQQQLATLTETYLGLKDALVATNVSRASQEATLLLDQLSKIEETRLEGKAQTYWMDQKSALQSHGQRLAESEDVVAQRQQFNFLSQVLIQTLKVFGSPDTTFYVQHCPMAFNNSGADWISTEEAIRNPYFGDEMMTCGYVDEAITGD